MANTLIQLLINFSGAAFIFLLLRAGVLSKDRRHLQLFGPVLLLIVWVLVFIAFNNLASTISTGYGYFRKYGIAVGNVHIGLFVLFEILFFFGVVKLGVKRALLYYLDRKKKEINFITFAYKEHNNTVLLKRGFKTPFAFTKNAIYTLTGFLVLVFVSLAIPSIIAYTPFIIIIPLSILLEVYWYLGGNQEGNPKKHLGDDEVPNERSVDFYKVWLEYQQIWKENLLLAWAFRSEVNQDVEAKYNQVLGQLEDGNDLIIVDSIYTKLNDSFFKHIEQVISEGGKILILVADNFNPKGSNRNQKSILEWVIKGLNTNNDFAGIISPYETGVNPDSEVLVTSVNDLLRLILNDHTTTLRNWINDIEFTVLFNSESIFAENQLQLQSLLKHLKKKQTQLAFLSGNQQGLQSSVQNNYPIQNKFIEVDGFENLTPNVFCLFWREENERFQDKLQKVTMSNFIGTIPSLATIALKNNTVKFRFVTSKKLPLVEQIEEFDNDINDLTPAYRKDSNDKLIPHLRDINPFGFVNDLIEEKKDNILFVFDDEYNLIHLFKRWSLYAQSNILLNVVSPSYLLRDYFIDNFKYFILNPVDPFALFISKSKKSVGLNLLYQLSMEWVTEEYLKNRLQTAGVTAFDVTVAIQKQFFQIFNIVLQPNWIQIKTDTVFDVQGKTFIENNSYRIDVHYINQLSFLKRVRLVDNANTEFAIMEYDFFFQNYIPGQRHVIYNRYYTIESFSEADLRCVINNTENTENVIYKQNKTIEVYSLQEISIYGGIENERIEVKLLEGDFKVETNGYFAFRKGIDFKNNQYFDYVKVSKEQVPERAYVCGRALQLNLFKNSSLQKETELCIVKTIQALIHEIIPTLFPQVHNYVLVSSAAKFGNKQLSEYFSSHTFNSETADERLLYIFEDCNQDVGVAEALTKPENIDLLFELMVDYLRWSQKKRKIKNFGEILGADTDFYKAEKLNTDFLKYGFPEHSNDFCVESTLTFLLEKFGKNEKIVPNNVSYFTKILADSVCDFCGNKINTPDYTIYPDGREQCSNCESVAVKSQSELQTLFDEVKVDYFDNFRKLKLPEAIKLTLVDTKFISEHLGGEYIPTNKFDTRSIGFASKLGNDYSIYIEDGFDAEKVRLTLVHELTHIFQYYNLNYEKMTKISGDLHIEGHTTWAEIDYLQSKNKLAERAALEKEYLSRDDKYGQGLKLILDNYSKGRFNANINIHEALIIDFPSS